VAYLLFLLSLGGAIAMIAIMTYLVVRRRIAERKLVTRLARENAMVEALAAGTFPEADAREHQLRNRLALSVAARMIEMLRGSDRDRLISLIEVEGVLQPAFAMLASRRPEHRIEGIRAIESFDAPSVRAQLVQVLANDSNLNVRLSAGLALARLRALPGVLDTISLLRLQSRMVTPSDAAMLRMLAETDGEALVHAVDAVEGEALRAALIEASGATVSIDMSAEIARWADERSAVIRRAVANCLGRYRYGDDQARLANMARDPDWKVRLNAVHAMAKKGFRPVPTDLGALFDDANPLIGACAQRYWL
jgi:HEAT repeat protein